MPSLPTRPDPTRPLATLEEWDDFLKRRYPDLGARSAAAAGFRAANPNKTKEEFRNYEAEARPTVREFYRLNHRHQTYDFVLAKQREYLQFNRREMGIWEAAEFLNTLGDDSEPGTDLSPLEHLLRTAEAIRRDGRPRWFILAGFVHDLGKVLCLFGEPQWAVVGDTFPVGCRYSPNIVFPEFFAENPDSGNERFQTRLGAYTEQCGLDQVQLSWGHDEYIYQVAKPYLPKEALYMLRYHSFYPWHREGAYDHLCNDEDRSMLKWVIDFNQYDLYTKSHDRPDLDRVRPFYQELIAGFFPPKLRW